MYKVNEELPSTEQMVINLPDITTETIDKDAEFLIIACDGVWDWLSSQAAVDYIKAKETELK